MGNIQEDPGRGEEEGWRTNNGRCNLENQSGERGTELSSMTQKLSCGRGPGSID